MLINANSLHIPLVNNSVQMVCTSPPYFGLRRYGIGDEEIGTEQTPNEYVDNLVAVFREVRRVLRPDGVVFLNLGDSYNGSGGAGGDYNLGGLREGQPKYPGRNVSGLKSKDLIGIPWRVAFALQEDGWYLRSDIIWSKVNPMPEPVMDRPVKSHEYIFLLSKNRLYYYDAWASRERVATHYRNRRSVWTIPTSPYKGSHFATYPPALVEPCILAGTSEKGCCPICGKPWTRIIKREKNPLRDMEAQRRVAAEKTGRTDGHISGPSGMVDKTETVGWQPSCSCGKEPIPCLILDPFTGASTTGLVAERLGRRFVGIDLSMEYLKLSQSRLSKARLPMFEGGIR